MHGVYSTPRGNTLPGICDMQIASALQGLGSAGFNLYRLGLVHATIFAMIVHDVIVASILDPVQVSTCRMALAWCGPLHCAKFLHCVMKRLQ